MNQILISILFLVFSFTTHGQSYLPDQIIIQYAEETSPDDQQIVRDLCGITNITNIGEEIDLWNNLVFPLAFSKNGQTEQINNIEELALHRGVRNGDEGQSSTARSKVQNNDLNYILKLLHRSLGVLG
jgi:hypothetical protein